MNALDKIKSRARAAPATIVLSEGEDARTRVRAADVVLGRFLSLFDAANTARRIAEMGDELDELKDKVA